MLSYHICGLKCGKLTDKGRHKVITITQINFHVSELKKSYEMLKKSIIFHCESATHKKSMQFYSINV